MKWIYTSLDGQIKFKDLSHNMVDEVILALLLNLNKDEFKGQKNISQDDLVSLFGKKMVDFQTGQNINQNICFALHNNKRHIMDITSLCSIKTDFKKGLDALQLYNIPNRTFDKCFYFHNMEYHDKRYKHSFTRLSINTIDLINCKQNLSASEAKSYYKGLQDKYEENISETSSMFQPLIERIHKVSSSILLKLGNNIDHLQSLLDKAPSSNFVQNARLIYLVELSNENIP